MALNSSGVPARSAESSNALHAHGRTIGHGVRASDAPDAPPACTGTSQYAIAWAEGEGPRISNLHPWVSPY